MGFCAGRLWASAVLALGLVACATSVQQSEPEPATVEVTTPEQALERLFGSAPVQSDWFTPQLAALLPPADVEFLRNGYRDEIGAFRGIREDEDVWLVAFERGIVPVFLRLAPTGEISTLWFNLTEPLTPLNLEQVEQLIGEYDGEVAVLVERDGEVLLEQRADEPLAVGSAFKLTVLHALLDALDAGTVAADETLPLRAEQKSLPSGYLQDKETGSLWRVDELARRMMSNSDNTATDMLIDRLGRAPVEALSPRNTPFLRTADAFRLKNPANDDLLSQWRSADQTGRRALLNTLQARPLPGIDLFSGAPVALDVEWFYSARELCATLKAVGFTPVAMRDSAQLDADRWQRVAYKGGSEPGVINQSFLLEDAQGRTSCVVATWNRADGMVPIPFLRLVSHLARLARELP